MSKSASEFCAYVMEKFARIIVGYHGCSAEFSRKLLLGKQAIADWKPSDNKWDWLGGGIYLMNNNLSTKEMIKGARKALEASKLPPRALFAHLVELGWIDARGRVTKLLGGTADPEAGSTPRNGHHARP
jgi:hypothetical protein